MYQDKKKKEEEKKKKKKKRPHQAIANPQIISKNLQLSPGGLDLESHFKTKEKGQ